MEGDPGEAGSEVKLTLGADIEETDYKLVLTEYRDNASVQDCSRSLTDGMVGTARVGGWQVGGRA